MAVTFIDGLTVSGASTFSSALTLSTIANASSDTDKFLVSDSGVIKYRTGAEVRSDIGAGTGTVTSVASGDGLSGGTITGSGTLTVDSTVVRTTGTQTIGGSKTFSSAVKLNSIATAGEETVSALFEESGVVTKKLLGANAFTSTSIPTNAVLTSGNQTVAGIKTFSSNTVFPGSDGGMEIGVWAASTNYGFLGTQGMTGSEYCLISDGQTTFVGGGTGGSLKLRGPANDSSPQIVIDGTSVTVDDGSNVGQGSIRAKYKSSDNSSGITSTFTVRNGNNSASLTFVIKDGVVTSVTSSDRRLKKNIKLIGKSPSGINIYEFQYKVKYAENYGTGKFQGVMSDEVPWRAVTVDKGGYDMVDYSMIDVEFKKL